MYVNMLRQLCNQYKLHHLTQLKTASTASKSLKHCWVRGHAFCKHQHIDLIANINSRSISTSFNVQAKTVTINFIDRHGKEHNANAVVGDSLLDVIIDHNFNFETYGVCEGTLSCSTCHVILDKEVYNKMEEPIMDEMDMLDLAYGLTDTSRLGCQVYVTEDMDGVTVTLPKEITDARDL